MVCLCSQTIHPPFINLFISLATILSRLVAILSRAGDHFPLGEQCEEMAPSVEESAELQVLEGGGDGVEMQITCKGDLKFENGSPQVYECLTQLFSECFPLPNRQSQIEPSLYWSIPLSVRNQLS